MINGCVSVIIPVYNSEEFLERLFRSLDEQTYKNFEIIAVNDGSTDNSKIILEKYSKQFAGRFIYCEQQNRGAAAARNRGLELVSGEFICFIDSDDYVRPEYLAQMIKHIDDVDIVICSGYQIINGQIKRHKQFTGKKDRVEYIKDVLLKKNGAQLIWDKLCRRNVFENYRFVEGRIRDDMHAAAMTAMNVNTVAYIEDELYIYCMRDDSISGVINDRHLTDFTFLAQKIVHEYMAAPFFEQIRPEIDIYLSRGIERMCKNYVYNDLDIQKFKDALKVLLELKQSVEAN